MASPTARVMIAGPSNLNCVELHNFQKNKRKECRDGFQEFRTNISVTLKQEISTLT